MGTSATASLGTIGSVLTAALGLGYLGRVGLVTTRMDTSVLSEIRAFTLAIFLAVGGTDAAAGFIGAISQFGV